jgi:hypothetical protein
VFERIGAAGTFVLYWKEVLNVEIKVIDVMIRRASDFEKAMKYAEASLNVEGMYTTKKQNELIRKSLRGEISHEEFLRQAVELAKNE